MIIFQGLLRFVLIVFSLCMLLTSCVKSRNDKQVQTDNHTDSNELLQFITEPEESAWLEAKRNSGGLQILATSWPGIYYKNSDGSTSGFHYKLFKDFARLCAIDYHITTIDFANFFIPKNDTPDLIKQYDLYMSDITILPEREKVVSFIPLYPTRILLLTKKGKEISAFTDMRNKKVVTGNNSSFEHFLKELDSSHHLNLEYLYVSTSHTFGEFIISGDADLAATDAELTIIELKNHPELNLSFPISDIQTIGWAVKKDDTTFRNLLNKFIRYAYDTGLIDTYWLEEYGMSMERYKRLLEY